MSITVKDFPALPPRAEPRPDTTPATPHLQLDQWAPEPLQVQLWERMVGLEGVRAGRSNVSAPSSRALHLEPSLALGPREAFMAGTEFAHFHGDGSGSLHLALPASLAADAVETGWAEVHPVVHMGLGPANWVMLYGPRDEVELEQVWEMIESSYEFARGVERSSNPARSA